MIILWILAFIHATKSQKGATPYELAHLDDLYNVAAFEDAEHRGPKWYGESETSASSKIGSDESKTSSSTESDTDSSSESSEASSYETKEIKLATQVHRTCTPCPQDMLKKRTNIGIKWICGFYQRARRSFKSICMMRYRNCEDGTLFVKLHDHRCKNDTYHGKHWFYEYRI